MLERLKHLFEDSSLAWYIKAAGLTGIILVVIEVGRVAVDLYHHFK